MFNAVGYRDGKPFDVLLCAIDGDGHSLDEDAALAFALMAEAAAHAGHAMRVNSAFREHAKQASLWRKWEFEHAAWQKAPVATRGRRPLRPSRPGHSKHESGLAVDIDVFDDGGKERPLAAWLRKHAAKYGFENTVPAEPWHYEYKGGHLDPTVQKVG